MGNNKANIFEGWNWNPPIDWMNIKTIDMHTGGEPLRIFIEGLPEIKGSTILEKRRFFQQNYDNIRQGIMFEPRGHADMYGAIITEPCTPDADFGVFFMHNEGYSTMCGHAIIAITKLVIETGLINKPGDSPLLIIDAPPGRILSSAKMVDGQVEKVSFINVPSYVLKHNMELDIEGLGMVKFDIAFGGAFYALCNAESLGLDLDESDYNRLIDYGKRIKKAVSDQVEIKHPYEEDLGFLYGTIFTGKARNENHHSRNVCVFAEGEVDRSATGTGVSARAALHYSKGELKVGSSITIESIIGSTMDVKVVKTTKFGHFDAILPEVSGTAYFTGSNEFWFDPKDPLKKGFIFR